MTDYLGPLTFGNMAAGGTYTLKDFSVAAGSATIVLTVSAASEDALAAAIEALVAQLQIGNTYAHHQPGTTHPVVYRIVGVSGFAQAGDGTWHAYEQRVTFTLTLAGQPAGALTTLYSAQHVDAPASLSLAALLGTHPCQPDVTVDDDSGLDMHSVLIALAPSALSDDKWRIFPTSATFTTMTDGSGTSYWNNTMVFTTSATAQTGIIDTSKHPAGKYRIFVRVCQEAGTGYVKHSQDGEWVAITRSTPHLMVIGDVDLPTADVLPGMVAPLTLSIKSDGSNDCILNAILLIPLDYGYAGWHHTTAPTTEIDELRVGPSGRFVDGVCDDAFCFGGVLTARVLAAHVGTLVTAPAPTGSNWPPSWDKTASGVSADTSRFKCVGASKFAWMTTAACPLVMPGAWYELSLTRDVDSYAAGAATAEIVWTDVDGNVVQTDLLSSVAANDAAPVTATVYAKAPVHSARAMVRLGTSATGDLTVYYSAVVLRRCPMRLIVVAEDAGGALVGNVHPVHVSLRYTPKYEVAR